MESEGMNLLRNSTVLISVFVGACVLLLVYILKQLNADPKNVDDKPKNEKHTEQAEKKKESATSGKGKKKGGETRWSSRSDKQAYSHPWLLTSLKGHTAQVQDMDFASNGKYLASCAEEDLDPDPGGDLGLDGDSTSSGNSDSNRESSVPSSATPSPRTKGLSRRQRKNRRRDDHSPTEIKKKAKAKRPEASPNTKVVAYTPSKYYLKLKQLQIPEYKWPHCMTRYVLRSEEMMPIGYPVFSKLHQGHTVIFKSFMALPAFTPSSYRYAKINVTESRFDVNAQEFVPGMDYSEIKAEWNANHDSGQGSGCSSDSGEVDSEENSTSSDGDLVPQLPKFANSSKTYFDGSQDELYNKPCSVKSTEDVSRTSYKDTDTSLDQLYSGAEERACSRCSQPFFATTEGKYITQDRCWYHWGKLHNGKHKSYSLAPREYSCCKGKPDSRGCTVAKLHVWSGVSVGFNLPDSFVYTRPRRTLPPDGNCGMYALDCEMCYTAMGLELTKVTVVGTDGRLVYDSFVKPEQEIIDYNTRFSGITAKDLNRKSATKTLREVQNDLMGFISADTILIGHGLENDLRVLKIVHYKVIDTSIIFAHEKGLPYRRSLKQLASFFLKRDIQCGANGHNSFEDALTCMELMLWKFRNDLKYCPYIFDQCQICI